MQLKANPHKSPKTQFQVSNANKSPIKCNVNDLTNYLKLTQKKASPADP